jgi:hypothetical protein
MVTAEILNAVYCKIENRPGTLQRAAHALGERKINIDGVSADTWGNAAAVRFVTTRAKEAVDALRHANLEAYESQIVLCQLMNKPNELAHACSELAAAGINVEAVTTTADGRLAFRASDTERTAQILRKL